MRIERFGRPMNVSWRAMTAKERASKALEVFFAVLILGGVGYGIVACDEARNRSEPPAQREQRQEQQERQGEVA